MRDYRSQVLENRDSSPTVQLPFDSRTVNDNYLRAIAGGWPGLLLALFFLLVAFTLGDT